PQYRFVNDFSNSYRQQYVGYSAAQMTNNGSLNSQPLPFDGSPVNGNGSAIVGFSNNQLAGSRQVTMGINVKPYHENGYNKADMYQPGEIEGFKITNESGAQYRF